MTGIEKHELEQQIAHLAGLRAKLAGKIGWEQMNDITAWYRIVGDVGCPNCGVDFRRMPPEANIYPHWTGACKATA